MNSQYKELSDKAFYYHQRGEFEKALSIYNALLKMEPDDANILNLTGLIYLASGNGSRAAEYLTRAFIISRTPLAASNLAKAYYSLNQPEKAVQLFQEALKTEQSDDTYYSLGLAYKKTGDLKSAIEAYHKALELNPSNYSACYNLSSAYIDTGNNLAALAYAEKCTLMRQDDEFLYGMLSGLYEKANDYEAAVKALEKAIALNPGNFLYYYNAAVLSSMLNQSDKAIYYYLKAVSANPNHIESYVNLANIVKEQDNEKAAEYLLKAYEINPKEENLLLSLAQTYKDSFKNEESIKILKELLYINPMCADAYSITAMNYMDLCMYEKALENYDLALKLNPDDLNFKHGRAVCLKYLGRIDECRKILESLAANENAPAETKITLGMLYLQNKEFKKGMELYRLRKDNVKPLYINEADFWKPDEPLEGKTVLVYSNCGLGDSIMYARYLPSLAQRAGKAILQTDREIAVIMQDSFPEIQVINKNVHPPKFDRAVKFMELPYALNLDFNNIPMPEGYLKANEDAVKMYSKLDVFKTDKKKAGLFWQGNKRIFKNRSVKFDIIKRLAENKNVNFYSFQIGFNLEETDNFFDLTKHIKDYSDTAALLKNIDVLITIDSSIAHMAGALGVKTYLMLPKTAEWRWFNDEKNTPWYKSVTIFKQNNSADWENVIKRINEAL